MYDYAKCIFGKGNKSINLMKSALKYLTSNKQPKKRYWRGDDEYNASRKVKMFLKFHALNFLNTYLAGTYAKQLLMLGKYFSQDFIKPPTFKSSSDNMKQN